MHHRFSLALTLASALAVLTACGDDLTDPTGLMESAEAEAVMRSAEALPLLTEFLESTPATVDRERATLLRARELWDAGLASDGPAGFARRRLAIRYATPVLVASVPAEEWATSRERVDAWMVTVSTMLRHLSMPDVEARIEAARAKLQQSDAATSDRERVRLLLLASSELVETTPRFVARSLAADAEAAVGAAARRASGGPPRATLERAERLKDWAAQAVVDGDYLLAIQRAYYAIQLVEER